PQVVAVVGEAGSGKSRLLYEWKRESATEGTVIFEGRCSSMSQSAPYQPFIGMMRSYFGLLPGDAPAENRRKIAARLGQAGAHPAETPGEAPPPPRQGRRAPRQEVSGPRPLQGHQGRRRGRRPGGSAEARDVRGDPPPRRRRERARPGGDAARRHPVDGRRV